MVRKLKLEKSYSNLDNRIKYEFYDPENYTSDGTPYGGLITISRLKREETEAPYLRVDVHALDGDVEVVAPTGNLPELYLLLEINWNERGLTVQYVSFNKQEIENELAELHDYHPSRNYMIATHNRKDWE